MTERRIKIVGRDTNPPSRRLRTQIEVVSAFEDVYSELFNLAKGMENEPSERIKALSECRRVLADLLTANKTAEKPEENLNTLFSILPQDEDETA
jgi:hypothetical protein